MKMTLVTRTLHWLLLTVVLAVLNGPSAGSEVNPQPLEDGCELFFSDRLCETSDVNLIGSAGGLNSPKDCQEECSYFEDCVYFSWRRKDSNSGDTVCDLLRHCNSMKECSSDPSCFYSLSGPILPHYPEVCCDMFKPGLQCQEEVDGDVLQVIGGVATIDECQTACQDMYPVCKTFTYWQSWPNLSKCTLLATCTQQQACPSCVSGPVFPVVHQCSDFITTTVGTTELTSPSPGGEFTALLLGGRLGTEPNPRKVESWPCVTDSEDIPDIPEELDRQPGAAYHGGMVHLCGGYAVERREYSKQCYTLVPHGGDWTTSSPMVEARSYFSLNKVGSVLVAAGGYDGSKTLSSIEVYSKGTWKLFSSSLPGPRRSHCAAAVSEEDIVFVGGKDGVSDDLDSVIKFNIVTGAQTNLPPLPFGKVHAAACALDGDFLIVSGGYNSTTYLNTVAALDLRSFTWNTYSDLNYARHYHTMAMVDGLPTVFGSGFVKTLEVLRNGKWEIEQLAHERSNHAMAMVPCQNKS